MRHWSVGNVVLACEVKINIHAKVKVFAISVMANSNFSDCKTFFQTRSGAVACMNQAVTKGEIEDDLLIIAG